MSVVWNPPAVPHAVPIGGTAVTAREQALAASLVLAAVLFNWVLCFINTTLFAVSVSLVVGAEAAVIGMALALVWYRGYSLYAILLTLTGYLFIVMLVRSEFDAKIVRDLLIPIAFFFLGSYLGSLRWADRVVTLLIVIALGIALFEWLALNTYLHYFDVIHYYMARGTEQTLEADSAKGLFIRGAGTTAGLFINATRFDGRTLLPFLGEHRVSGIFMEPVSVGNFGAIAFAWVLLRDRGFTWTFVAKVLAIATILVLADARFGFYLCVATVFIYVAAPYVRPTILFVAPFVAIVALAAYGGFYWQDAWDNSIAGRFLSTGVSLASLDPWHVLGLRISDVFVSGYAGDNGYGYTLVKVGLVGAAAIWALFVYGPALDADAWRFKSFIAFYIAFLLTVSASLYSIKTAALLWFLCGTLNNPNRIAWQSPVATGAAAA
jgi:putative polymerase